MRTAMLLIVLSGIYMALSVYAFVTNNITLAILITGMLVVFKPEGSDER